MPTMTRQLSSLRSQRNSNKDARGYSYEAGPSSSKDPNDDHTFRIVTAKRVFVLCAPSEEDEIKWLAAFRALLNRGRDRSHEGQEQGSSGRTTLALPHLALPPHAQARQATHNQSQQQAQSQPFTSPVQSQSQPLPHITAQPPTPASTASGGGNSVAYLPLGDALPTPSASTSQGPPIWAQAQAQSSGREMYGDGTTDNPGNYGGRGRSATYTAQKAVADAVRRYRPDGGAQGQHA